MKKDRLKKMAANDPLIVTRDAVAVEERGILAQDGISWILAAAVEKRWV